MTDNDALASGGTATDDNDWRVTVRPRGAGQAGRAAGHLGSHQVEAEVHERLGGRVAISTDGRDELFLYTHSGDAADAARQSVSELLASHGVQADYTIERWHPVAEEWEDADIPLPHSGSQLEAERHELDAEETKESLTGGVALFEVRVQLPSHRDSVALASRLQADGYPVVRRWRFLVVGANNADQAEEFAAKIRQEAPDGAVISTEEVGPGRPYTVFELAAGSGL